MKIFAKFSNRNEEDASENMGPFKRLFSLDAPHSHGMTALMKAASMGKSLIIDILLKNNKGKI